MFATERRRRILEHVRRHGTADLRELAQAVDASEVTIRRDLRALEQQGLIARHRGGAAALQDPGVGSPSTEGTDPAARPEQVAIARLAATLVHDGDAVAIGAGTTAQQLAAKLVDASELTVVTNSLLVGEVLGQARGVSVV
ncbi:MAG: DeoR/GlpR transcriptional regulator, partial [Cellulomonas sp.]|nr:DeoR/GlpR transcriptional regulator [Cellulomonas sp.]